MQAQAGFWASIGAGVFSNLYLSSALQIAAYLLFLTAGILIAYRSGIFFLAAQGIFTVSAAIGYYVDIRVYRAALGTVQAGTEAFEAASARAAASAWPAGLAAGLAAGLLFTLLVSWFLLYTRSNTLLVSLTLNLFAAMWSAAIVQQAARAPGGAAQGAGALPTLTLQGAQGLPVLGGLFGSTGWFTYLALLTPFFVFYLVDSTGFGLKLRAAQENPAALVSAGLSPARAQLWGLLFAGGLVSLGGVVMVLGHSAPALSAQVNGVGYLGLAAVWACDGRIWKSSFAALLLALVGALPQVIGSTVIPLPLLQALLYLAALGGLLVHTYNDRFRFHRRAQRQRQILRGEELSVRRRKGKKRAQKKG